MADVDEKPEVPVHLILGASEYSKIKTATKPRIGQPGEPVAELTKFGWTFMSSGSENDTTNTFTKSSAEDYQKLCDLDVLGLNHQSDEEGAVYQDVKTKTRMGCQATKQEA
jgi:hypothetical protein